MVLTLFVCVSRMDVKDQEKNANAEVKCDWTRDHYTMQTVEVGLVRGGEV